MNPRKKRIVVAVGLIVLIVAVGVAVHGPGRSMHELQNLLQRTGIATTRSAAVTTLGPATSHLRALLKTSADSTIVANKSEDDDNACGLNQLRAALNGEKQAAELLAQSHAVLDEVATRMSKSAIEQERAMGFLALMGSADFAGALKSWDEIVNCANDEACIARRNAERQRVIAPHVTALAQMAHATNDPAIYAAAFYACLNGGSEASACKSITAENWLAMDRNNAVPLLFIAGAAGQPQDTPRRAQALFAASNAVLYEPRALPIQTLSESAAIQTAPPSIRFLINHLLAAQFTGYFMIDYMALFSYCKPPADSAPGKRETCSRLAEMLVYQDGSLVGLDMARLIGVWLQWPADRLAALNDERDAAVQVFSATAGLAGPTTCAGVASMQNYVSDLARFGEVPALRRQIVASGKSTSTLAAEYREASRKRAADEAARKTAK